MKRPYPDVYPRLVQEFTAKLAYLRKFKKYWGTTTVNGEEVLRLRNYYYKASRQISTYEKWARLVGVWNDTKNPRMKGIKRAWFYLDPQKFSLDSVIEDVIDTNLSEATWNGTLSNEESLQVSVVISPKAYEYGLRYPGSSSLLTRNPVQNITFSADLANQAAAISEVEANYSNYWMDYTVTSGTNFAVLNSSNIEIDKLNPNDPWVQTLARYVMFSTDIPREVVKVSEGTTTVYNSYISNRDVDNLEDEIVYFPVKVPTLIIDIKIPAYSITTSTDIVNTIKTDISGSPSYFTNEYLTQKTILGARYLQAEEDSEIEDPDDVFDRSPSIRFGLPVVNLDNLSSEYWVQSGNDYYLKAAFFTDSGIPLDDRINILNNLIASDYKKKSASFLEKIAVIAIFVVAVIFTPFTGGGSLAIAQTILFAAAVVQVVGVLASATGNYMFALATTEFLQAIEPLVIVASIVTLFAGIGKLAEQGAKKLAQEAGKEVTQEVIEGILKDQLAEALFEGIKGQFTNLFSSSLTNIDLNQVIKLTNMVFDVYKKNQLESLSKKIKDAKQENDKYIQEQSRVNDLLMDINIANSNPLTAEGSYYASIYDMPYEPQISRFHIGNIQATTIQALRLADES